jgi:hypothetical protein
VAFLTRRTTPFYNEPLSFDDCAKKKIIGNSVLPSLVGYRFESFGLDAGSFVRWCFCTGYCPRCAILGSTLNPILNPIFDPIFDPIFHAFRDS